MSLPKDVPHAEALAGSRSFIVGGTSGIGFAVASGALAVGGKVFITSSSSDKVGTAIKRLQALYPNASVTGSHADLSNNDSLESNIENLLNQAVSDLGGPLDHIIITAGSPPSGGATLKDITPATALHPTQTTLRLYLPLILAKLITNNPDKYIAATPKSSITLTSGILVKKPMPGMTPFMAFGPGLEGLKKSLSIDLKPVRVNLIFPGAVDTELLQNYPENLRKSFQEKSLTGEIGTSWDVAEAYLFCMRSRFFTGQEIVIDGGATSMPL